MVFKVARKLQLELLRRLCGKSAAIPLQFDLAVREVMAARILLAMTGRMSAAEARRMVAEKNLAAMRAQLAYTEAILNGQTTSATDACFDVYRRAVESNRLRLRKRRWRLPRPRRGFDLTLWRNVYSSRNK